PMFIPKHKPEIWNNQAVFQGPSGFGSEKLDTFYHSFRGGPKNNSNLKLNEMIDKIPSIKDPAEKKRLEFEAAKVAFEERSSLTFLYVDSVLAFGSRVGGLTPIQNVPLIAAAFETITLK
ncbi:MAG: hypothetical protein Q7O66_16515, partial [Dehalococcoidia bacterium]|nr:hypothetical protein [Dehalococcoidia bacterium]